MSKYAHAPLNHKNANGKNLSPKKMQKRYHQLEEDLADAQEALEEAQEDLEEAQERLQRSERRVQKRAARIQKIKQKIHAARISFGEDAASEPELASWVEEDEDDTLPVQTIEQTTGEIPAVAKTHDTALVAEPVANSDPTIIDEAPAEEISGLVVEEIATLERTPEGIEEVATLEQVAEDIEIQRQEQTVEEQDTSPEVDAAPAISFDTPPVESSEASFTEPAAVHDLRAASAPAERQTDEIVAVHVPTPIRASIAEDVSVSAENISIDLPPLAEQDQSASTFADVLQAQEQVITTEARELMAEANAVAEAAEEAADLAAERLYEFEQRLDQFVAGRHLEQDLAEMQAEVERSEQFALQARQAVATVETQATLTAPEPLSFVQPQAQLFDADADPLEVSIPPLSDVHIETEAPEIEHAPSLEEIDQEEAALEVAVSASITDEARQESQRVEAYAEASGARTQEARALVERVSLMVDMVVSAINSGILTGSNADEAMAAAEQEMSSAQAVLTALEIITERADSYSAEVEARAEVSEGMAYASEENWFKDTRAANDVAQIEHETV